MGRSTVIFAYSNVNTIPATGDYRKSFSCSYANGNKTVNIGDRDEALDKEILRDIYGKRLVLFVILGRDVLEISTNKDWFRAFLEAPYRWAVYGNFLDTANSANQNLCRCNPEEDENIVNIINDLENGLTLLSDKIYSFSTTPIPIPPDTGGDVNVYFTESLEVTSTPDAPDTVVLNGVDDAGVNYPILDSNYAHNVEVIPLNESGVFKVKGSESLNGSGYVTFQIAHSYGGNPHTDGKWWASIKLFVKAKP
ncbi:MAG: hypothetical protein IMZ53_12920 [Thermoplasmata archaeon]|nr:hypothetical protein [Thermoplasmata archaeon]